MFYYEQDTIQDRFRLLTNFKSCLVAHCSFHFRQPLTHDSKSVDPGFVDPGSVDPGFVDPGSVDAGSVDPGSVDPGSVDPGSVDPVDLGLTDPGSVVTPLVVVDGSEPLNLSICSSIQYL